MYAVVNIYSVRDGIYITINTYIPTHTHTHTYICVHVHIPCARGGTVGVRVV